MKKYILDGTPILATELGKNYEGISLFMIRNDLDASEDCICFTNLEAAVSYLETLPRGWCYYVYKEKVLCGLDYEIFDDEEMPGNIVGFLNYEETVYWLDKTDRSQFFD